MKDEIFVMYAITLKIIDLNNYNSTKCMIDLYPWNCPCVVIN